MSAAIDTAHPPLLEVRDLKVHFPVHGGVFRRVVDQVRAVDGVSFDVRKGTTVGLVGESGSGKTTIGRAIVKLNRVTSGTIRYDGIDITPLGRRAFFPYRKRIQMIFQDPFNSLDPRMTVEAIIREPLAIHFPELTRRQQTERAAALMEQVGLSGDHLRRYPHEFSGGQRQRIGIARALAVEPKLLICDEPVGALDVSVQAAIVSLLQDLQERYGFTYLFIAHDLAVVEHISDYVLVMTAGEIVERSCSRGYLSCCQPSLYPQAVGRRAKVDVG